MAPSAVPRMQRRSRFYNGNADQNVGHRWWEMFIETLRGVRTAAGWRGFSSADAVVADAGRATLLLPTLGGLVFRPWQG